MKSGILPKETFCGAGFLVFCFTDICVTTLRGRIAKKKKNHIRRTFENKIYDIILITFQPGPSIIAASILFVDVQRRDFS